MSTDFEPLHATAARSRLGRFTVTAVAAAAAAWRSSWSHRTIAARRSALTGTPNGRLAWCGTAIAVAAGGHLALRTVMAVTVVPVLPAMLFAGIAVLAAALALQPSAFARAWHRSRVARAFKVILSS